MKLPTKPTTEKPLWRCGNLREDMGPLRKGQLVFYRPVTMKLSSGPCWWVRPQGVNHFWMVAESYGGANMNTLIKAKLGGDHRPLLSPPERALEIEKMLRVFTRNLPAEALPCKSA